GVLRTINEHAAALAAIAGDHLVVAISIQIRGPDGMGLHQRIVDHLALAAALRLPIDRHLVAVPRLDGRQVTLLPQPPYRHIARTRLRPRRRIAFGDFGPSP